MDDTAVLEEPVLIRTPDQRLRVFVSSTLGELAPEREVVKAAVERLRLAPVMFELGARPHPPRTLYRAYLEQSHIFVGIYWQSYGWVAPDMEISGIEDEYRLAAGKPCLIYIKQPAADRQPQLIGLLERIKAEDRASYKSFRTPEELADLLAGDLALMLTERFEAAAEPAGGGIARLGAKPLPVPTTRLIGREDDVAAVSALLEDEGARLVTLTGMGGIGKSRLALEVAVRSGAAYPDGVFYVELAPVEDQTRVPTTIAQALNIQPEGTRPITDSLIERLSGIHVLLVLDNFEQVAGAAPFVADLLTACPDLRVLVTSRARLKVRGEREHAVTPLATPVRRDRPSLAEIETSAAVRLFIERGREVKPGCELTEQNAGDVAELCRRLDGVPLALELAAARLRVLSPSALLARIGASLDLFSGPADLPDRQRTLRATIDWSHRLLDEPERALFARLAVFVGGFTLESAQAVCGDDGDILDSLSSLVDKSLVALHDRAEGEPRFRMLQTVRQYALERLAGRGESDSLHRRFFEYVVAFERAAALEFQGPRNRVWMARMDDEIENMRAVWQWAAENGQIERLLFGGMDAWWYWMIRGHAAEWFDPLEAMWSADVPLSPPARMRLAFGVGGALMNRGHLAEAVPVFREALRIARKLGEEYWTALALISLGGVLGQVRSLGDPEALRSSREGVAIFRKLESPWGIAWSQAHLGDLMLFQGEPETAAAMHRECLDCARTVDSEYLTAQSLHCLGRDALAMGDVAEARARFVESAEMLDDLHNREGLAYCLEGLAGVALAEGSPEAAATMISAAASLRELTGEQVWPSVRSFTNSLIDAIRAGLGVDAFDAARRRGAEMRPEEALAFALVAVNADIGRGARERLVR